MEESHTRSAWRTALDVIASIIGIIGLALVFLPWEHDTNEIGGICCVIGVVVLFLNKDRRSRAEA
ncbi:MAG: hypothetical protein SPK00_08045 [Corynebacterium glucuronolyticum]|nr:hypothetical protein [Corynebacterium glucuronolyticum]MDD7587263.1 hypothetical protein [Mycobacteriaceae bacterium]MDY5834682.1 hypothetical protein [Corynebacterium glucuronolyticum]